MANKSLTNLRDALASMWGHEWSDLDTRDQADIDSWINAAYFSCYMPPRGKRFGWAEQYQSFNVLAPVTVTLGMTNGSEKVTGYAFSATYAGSLVKIGDRFYRFGGIKSSEYYLVQKWDGATGNQTATVYFNAFALPWNVTEVCEAPSILGVGPLTPIPGPEAEIAMRSGPGFDFQPRRGRAPFAYTRPTFDPNMFVDVGSPVYYHIDGASVGPDYNVGNRFHLYPLPDRAYTIDLRADIVPDALSDGNVTPLLPAKSIDNILLPIAREKLAKNTAGRRFTGPNVSLIMDEAREARDTLARLAVPQRSKNKQISRAPGW